MPRDPHRVFVPRTVSELAGAKCRYCGAAILWGWTAQGRRVPLDPAGTVAVAGGSYLVSHWATCTEAERAARVRDRKRDQARRRREGPGLFG